ncbi:MAG: ion transporter [Micrococcales bacterium]|nr:ion transporter [Micrococcales bacterium]MCL2666665.1 ion transporter [Micrococcales bacterium]
MILLNAAVLGMETVPDVVDRYGGALNWFEYVFISVYVAEMLLKLFVYRRSYFRSKWNVFDFLIIVSSLGFAWVFTGLRTLRILRVATASRLVSRLRPLRRIASSIMGSLPGVGWTVLLTLVLYYIFAIVGIHLFRDENPERFGTLPAAFRTLFELTTLEDWQGNVFPITSVNGWAWIYFLIFILAASFVLVNVILGIVVDSLSLHSEGEIIEAAREPDATNDDILRSELAKLRAQIDHIAYLMDEAESDP